MSKSEIEVMQCDRCYATEEIRSPHLGYEWGRIHSEQRNGPLGIGRGGKAAEFKDLCPACLKQVDDWFYEPARVALKEKP